MAARRRRPRPDRGANEQSTGSGAVPAQEDEADILEEVEAERDAGGEFLTTEEHIREVGAVDAASVRDNRRMDAVVGKKRGGVKDVPFNTDDVLVMYEGLIRVWPPNTLDISVRRLTASPVQEYIRSRPRSGAELFEALKLMHGQSPEAEYEVRFIDTTHKQFRGTGRITLPDMRPPGQQGQPMQPPYPYGQPGYPGPHYPHMQQQAAPVPQQPQPQQQTQPAPYQQQAPQVPFDPMQIMDQMFGLFQRMQATAQPPAPAPQQPFVPTQTFAAPPQPPPMPAPGASQAEMMAWVQKMFELFQRMQPQQQPAQNMGQQYPQMNAGMPPAPPPPGMVYVPGIGYIELARVMRAIAPEEDPRNSSQPYPRPPYGPRSAPYRPPYGQPPQQGVEGQQPQSPYGAGYPQHPQQQQQRSPADQFRESLSVFRSARAMLNEVEDLFPGSGGGGGVAETPEVEDDDSPVRVIDTGAGKIVVNKSDGTTRPWETALANMDKAFKWIGDQAERVQKVRAEQAAQEERHRQPPPTRRGYVAVPVQPVHEQPAPVQSQPQYQPPQQQPQPQQPAQGLAPAPSFVPPQVQPGGGRLWGGGDS